MTAHLSHNSPSVDIFCHGAKRKEEEEEEEEENPSVIYLDNFVFLGHRLTFATNQSGEEVQSFFRL